MIGHARFKESKFDPAAPNGGLARGLPLHLSPLCRYFDIEASLEVATDA
jgi:hypothetical protein